MEIKLKTHDGDADLYVKLGTGTPGDDDLYSIASGTDDDIIKVDVKKGDKVTIAVEGYRDSDFSLEVVNKASATA